MESQNDFSGFLNMDDFVEELPQGDYTYALNVAKSTVLSDNKKIETFLGSVAVSTGGLIGANHRCVGIISAPKDDIAYLFFQSVSSNVILALAPSTLSYSLTAAATVINTNTITYANNTTVAVGHLITGTGIPQFTVVTQVLSNTSCVLSQNATATNSGLTLSGSYTTNTISLVLNYINLAFVNQKANRVTGFALGGNLYFTDNNSEPKCTSLTRYAGGGSPTNIEEVYMLKRGPRYAPYTDYVIGISAPIYGWGKGQDGTGVYNNTIYQDTQFAAQYQYVDGQLSVLSPYSPMIRRLHEGEVYNFIRIRLTQDMFSVGGTSVTSGSPNVTCTSTTGLYPGVYINDNNGNNITPYLTRIASITDGTHYVMTANALTTQGSLTFTYQNQPDTIPYLVTQVNLFARVGQTGTFVQVGQITRTLGGAFSTNNYIDYKGVTLGNVLDAHYLQQFENLPQQVGTMCAAGNRAWIGNYTEGYAKYDYSNITYGGVTVYNWATNSTTPGYSTFSELSTFKIGFILRDVNLRVMGVITQPNWVFNIPTFSTGIPQIYIAQLAATTLANLPIWVYDVGIVMTKDVNKSYFIKDVAKNGQWVSLTSTNVNGIVTPIQHFSLLYPNGIIVQSPTLTTNTSTGMTPGIYTGIAASSTSGSGTTAVFTVVVATATTFTSITVTSEGKNYAVNDTLTFNGALFGGGAGTSVWTINAVCNGAKYFALDISSFANAGKYYVWQEGDRINFYSQSILGGPYTQDLLIEAFDGTYVYCTPSSLLSQNMGVTLPNSAASSIESIIYRPIIDASAVNNLFYEQSNESWIPKNFTQATLTGINASLKTYNWGTYYLNNGFGINNSGTVSIPNVILEGDCVLGFSSFIFSAGPPALNLCLHQMAIRGNPVWNTSIGRPFVQTKVDLAQKNTYVRYGGTFVSGTSINQLAEFSSSSEQNISPNAGTVQKLQPTTRDSSQSSAILAICNTDTYSIYINEAMITSANASGIVSATLNVIGDVRQQQSGFGTLHPESVVMDAYGGIYWFDTLQKSFVKYTGNGLSILSKNKMSTYFYYQALANQGNELVTTGYDPLYEMVYINFTNAHGAGNVNGDATKLTVGFSIKNERFMGFFQLSGAAFYSGSKNMYSVVTNNLYRHGADAGYALLQGNAVNCGVSISVVPDQKPCDWKILKIMCSPGFIAWSAGSQYVTDTGLKAVMTNKDGQQATLVNNRASGEQEFEAEENIVYGVIKYDERSINSLTGVVDASSCLNGDPMTSNTLQIALTWTGGSYKYLRLVTLGYEPGRGHNV